MDISGFENIISGEEMAMIKLNEKYGTEFVIEKVQNVHMDKDYYTAIAYAADDPSTIFAVNVDFDGSGFSDNYVSKKVFQNISDIVGQNMDNLNGYFYIYSCPVFEATNLDNPDMTVKEYLELFQDENINVYIHYAPESLNADLLYDNIMNSFNGIRAANGMIYLSIVDEECLNAVQGYFENNDRIYDEYNRIVKQFYKGNIRVKKGEPVISRIDFIKLLEEK